MTTMVDTFLPVSSIDRKINWLTLRGIHDWSVISIFNMNITVNHTFSISIIKVEAIFGEIRMWAQTRFPVNKAVIIVKRTQNRFFSTKRNGSLSKWESRWNRTSFSWLTHFKWEINAAFPLPFFFMSCFGCRLFQNLSASKYRVDLLI